MGHEAGAGDVLAFLVRLKSVGGLDVVAHGTEDFLIKVSVCADGDDPFDAVAGGTGEEEGSGEFTVTEKHFSIHRHVGDVVEVLGLETGGLELVRDGAKALGLLLA